MMSKLDILNIKNYKYKLKINNLVWNGILTI